MVAGKPVYACAESFVEAVSAPAGSTVYGGLDCSSLWQYVGSAKKTSIEPVANAVAASQVALMLSGGEGTTHIEDVAVRAPDATQAGGSSIGALAVGGSVELVRCELGAGNGMAGSKGETPSESVGPSDPNDPKIRGIDGTAACMGNMSGNLGGAGTTNAMCSAVGGDGGTGQVALGEKGGDGQPLPDPNPTSKGLGGEGDPGDGSSCNVGAPGKIGMSGTSGAGVSSSQGALSSSGFIGAAGEPGTEAGPGQGGGGGGGAKGKAAPVCNGASGGGGGAGGCGGKGGFGGQGGGASIALASVGATVMMKDVVLSSRNGGDGGEGGDGQAGGKGGVGGLGGSGSGTLDACTGGQGGQGGFGGKGGGGRGGPSVGVAHTGTAPVMEGGSITTGNPGKGGAGADAAGTGADGMKTDSLELASP